MQYHGLGWLAHPLKCVDCDSKEEAIKTASPLPQCTGVAIGSRGNDPSAGSPTETLLRLYLPLNRKV